MYSRCVKTSDGLLCFGLLRLLKTRWRSNRAGRLRHSPSIFTVILVWLSRDAAFEKVKNIKFLLSRGGRNFSNTLGVFGFYLRYPTALKFVLSLWDGLTASALENRRIVKGFVSSELAHVFSRLKSQDGLHQKLFVLPSLKVQIC